MRSAPCHHPTRIHRRERGVLQRIYGSDRLPGPAAQAQHTRIPSTRHRRTSWRKTFFEQVANPTLKYKSSCPGLRPARSLCHSFAPSRSPREAGRHPLAFALGLPRRRCAVARASRTSRARPTRTRSCCASTRRSQVNECCLRSGRLSMFAGAHLFRSPRPRRQRAEGPYVPRGRERRRAPGGAQRRARHRGKDMDWIND